MSAADRLGKRVTATSEAQVIHRNIEITKDINPATVRQGDTVTFIITVKNSGDTPLTDVAVAAPPDDITNVATVTGKPSAGPPVTGVGVAFVDVTYPRR